MGRNYLVDEDGNVIDVMKLVTTTDDLDEKRALVTASQIFGRVDSSNVWSLRFFRPSLNPVVDNIYMPPVMSLGYGYDGTKWEQLISEPTTKALSTIALCNKTLLDGAMFSTSKYAQLTASGGAAPIDDYHIKVHSTKNAMLCYSVNVERESRIYLWEAPTTSHDGTLMNTYDNNRETANTRVTEIYHTPTVTSYGSVLLFTEYIPVNKNFGGDTIQKHMFLLKKSTNYIIRVANLDGTGTSNYSMLMTHGEF